MGTAFGLTTATYSQSVHISLSLTNKTVKEVFCEIEKNSDYIFFYFDEVVDVNRKVSIDVMDKPVEVILDQLFESTDNTYMIENRQILVSRKKRTDRSASGPVTKRTLTGCVTDVVHEPLAGVHIVVKGTSSGTISNQEGRFTLQVTQADPVLIISYVGYKTIEFDVGSKQHLEFMMETDELTLNEIWVIGYGFAKKRDLTGAITSVKGEKLRETAPFSTIEALQGRAAGVSVLLESARPGEEAIIRIRGNRSLKAINDPLFVIDGIPIVTGLSELNVLDIESVEILKDASSTAIYGSRGANGVILISTKKGYAGSTRVEYDGYFGIQKASRMIEMMNGSEWMELVREANRATTNTTPYPLIPTLEWDRKIGYFTSDPNVWNKVENSYDEEGRWHQDKVPYTDWTREALRTSSIQNHQIGVTGGNEKLQLLTSVTYFNHEGIVKGQDFSRYSVRVNFDWDLSSRTKLGAKTQFSHYDWNNGINLYDATKHIYPLADIFDKNGEYITERPGGDPQLWNQFLNLEHTKRETKKNRFIGSFYLEFKLPFEINYRTNAGIDVGAQNKSEFYGSLSANRSGSSARATNENMTNRMFIWENIIYCNKQLDENNAFGATLLQSVQQDTDKSSGIKVNNLPYESQYWYNMGSAQTIEAVSSKYVRWRLASFMGRINYNLKERYLFTTSARYDGSSRLASGQKWVLFPSAAFAWRISDENFLEGADYLTNLKIRIGYGITGNTSIDPYKTQGNLEYNWYNYDDAGVLSFYQKEMPSTNLSWEKTSQWNLGLDFGFFNRRIGGTVDVYRQETRDLLMERQLPVVSGFSNVLSNIGRVKNKGVEVSINTVNVDNRKLRWSTDFIFTTNREEIAELYNGKTDDEGNKWFIGKPIHVFYDYKADGIWQLEDAEELEKWGGLFKPGDIKVVDKNRDYKITSEDRYVLGQIEPKFTVSLSNYLTYRNFDFNFFLYGAFGQMKEFERSWSLNGRYNCAKVNYWKIIGEDENGRLISNKSNEAPRPSRDYELPNYINSLYYLKSSFLRIGQVTLGYSLSPAVCRKFGISKFRLYGTVKNLHVFTNYPGTDPETGRNFNEPRPKTFLLGINLTF
jgi:TonB-linked SusC/RagA family outer membrane protein